MSALIVASVLVLAFFLAMGLNTFEPPSGASADHYRDLGAR